MKASIAIITNHGKEDIFAPILEKELGAKSFLVEGFDTNQFGSFSGSIERKDDPISTLRNKCLAGLKHANSKIGVASEGSFGAHPSLPFIHCNEEWSMLIDLENDLEVIGHSLSTELCAGEKMIQTEDELIAFCEEYNFPNHGIILKTERVSDWKYDAESIEELLRQFNQIKSNQSDVEAVVDLRAHRNPTRRKNILASVQNLVKNYLSICPSCETPGFVVTSTIKGLPCQLCGTPTNSVKALKYICGKCGHEEVKAIDKKFEDPMYCHICNP